MDAIPNLRPGDKYIVRALDGTEFEDTVHSIRYTEARPEVRQQPRGWRRVLRNLTPHRWRNPLPIVQEYQPGGVEVIGVSEKSRRAARTLDDMNAAINRLLR